MHMIRIPLRSSERWLPKTRSNLQMAARGEGTEGAFLSGRQTLFGDVGTLD